MQADEFYAIVQERSHLDTVDRARTASTTVLETLGETLTAGESEDVARQLPDELADVMVDADHDGAGHDRAAFLERVGDRLRGTDLDPDDAERYADAVADAVVAAISEGERTDLTSQLESELAALFEEADVDRA